MKDQVGTQIFRYKIDQKNRIVFVSDEWLGFASDNLYTTNRETILNRSLWDFITDEETQHIYEMMIEKARAEMESLKVPFRCDSPECRRYMELELTPHEDGTIDFKSEILKLEFREPVSLLDVNGIKSEDDYLDICSWCKKIKTVNTEWLEVEEAVLALNLFESETLPKLTHGICLDCSEKMMGGFRSTG